MFESSECTCHRDANLGEVIANLGDEIANPAAVIANLGDEIDDLGEVIAHLGDEIANLAAVIANLGDEIDHLAAALDDLGDEFDHLGDGIANVAAVPPTLASRSPTLPPRHGRTRAQGSGFAGLPKSAWWTQLTGDRPIEPARIGAL